MATSAEARRGRKRRVIVRSGERKNVFLRGFTSAQLVVRLQDEELL
jgi:hypothetical protein